MTPARLFLGFFFAQSFWEARPPAEWTAAELKSLLSESPWSQPVSPQPLVQAVLETARPVEEAKAEMLRRGLIDPLTGAGALASRKPDIDYLDYMQQHRGEHFTLSIPYASLTGLGRADEERRLERESVMRIGRKQYPMIGHFPPTPSDPVLRLIFPRAATPADKFVAFDLFLPGINQPARLVEFRVKDLMYHGKLEM